MEPMEKERRKPKETVILNCLWTLGIAGKTGSLPGKLLSFFATQFKVASQMKSAKHLKNLVSNLLKLFQKNSKREHSQIHFMRLALP